MPFAVALAFMLFATPTGLADEVFATKRSP